MPSYEHVIRFYECNITRNIIILSQESHCSKYIKEKYICLKYEIFTV